MRKSFFHNVAVFLVNVAVIILFVFSGSGTNKGLGLVAAEDNDKGSTKPRFQGVLNIKGTKYNFKVDHGQSVEDAAALFGEKHDILKHALLPVFYDALASDL